MAELKEYIVTCCNVWVVRANNKLEARQIGKSHLAMAYQQDNMDNSALHLKIEEAPPSWGELDELPPGQEGED